LGGHSASGWSLLERAGRASWAANNQADNDEKKGGAKRGATLFQLFFILPPTDAVFVEWQGRLAFSVLFYRLNTSVLQKPTQPRTEKNNSYWKDIDCISSSILHY
jgi:hypothetical protein